MAPQLLDAASRLDLVISTDSAKTLSFVVQDENGNAIDYTGSTFDLKVKARDSNNNPTGSVLLTLSTGSGIAGDVSQGQFQPTFAAAALTAGGYVYEARRLVSAAPVEVVFVGTLDVVTGLS